MNPTNSTIQLVVFDSLSDEQRRERMKNASDKFREAGSHAVISSISELPGLLDEINQLQPPVPRVLNAHSV